MTTSDACGYLIGYYEALTTIGSPTGRAWEAAVNATKRKFRLGSTGIIPVIIEASTYKFRRQRKEKDSI